MVLLLTDEKYVLSSVVQRAVQYVVCYNVFVL